MSFFGDNIKTKFKKIMLVFCLLNLPTVLLWAQDSDLYWRSEKPVSRENIQQQLSKMDSMVTAQKWDQVLFLASSIKMNSVSINFKLGEVKAAIGLANAYLNLKEDDKAVEVLMDAIPLCTKKNETAIYKPYILNMLAVNAAYKGWFEKSIRYFEEALLATRVAAHPEVREAYILNNIAAMYTDLKMYDNAWKYFEKAELELKKNPNPATKVYLLWTKIHYFEVKDNKEKVEQYILEIEKLADSLNDFQTLFVIYEKKAGFAIKDQNYKAADSLLELMQAMDKIDPILKFREFRLAATIDIFRKNYKNAAAIYQKMYDLGMATKSIKHQHLALEGLASMSEKMGDYKTAYQNEIKARKLRDSINTEEQKRNIEHIEQKYQTAEKDKEIAEKELLITRQKSGLKTQSIILFAAAVVITLLFALFIIARRNHKRKQHLKDEQMRLFEREKELDEIRALMSGEEQERNRIARDIHDGLMIQFSTVKMNLSSVLSKQDEVKPYLQQLDKAIASLRSTAHNLMPDVLLDGGLAEAIYYFCENIKQHVAFEVTFNMLDDVPRFDEKFELAVYRIVQELIQNIVKHAQANEAYIQLGYREGLLNITIEDDGIGLGQSIPEAPKGLGLVSIRNRMQTLHGSMEISSEVDSGTSVVLEFSVEALKNDATTK